ncbi:MAG: toprim domain-containing protein, partial [Candidatus Wallbacteria bacterium]|nr:toprim domain-containing protein [Candidatus Wallbacteria bacterium]
MPKIPQDLIDRLKREVSLVRLAEARGITLTHKGKDVIGRCPFHRDKTPSLVIDPEKNLWHCFGACSVKGGDVITWIQRERSVSFRHAVEILKNDLPAALEPAPRPPVKKATVPILAPAVNLAASDLALLAQVAAYYHKKLRESEAALAYLTKRGIVSAEMIAHFQLGFSDRTLGLTLPQTSRQSGAAIRKQLTEIGILNPDTGHELYRGMITIPTFNEHGQVVGLYGRRILEKTHSGHSKHRNLAGPLRGLINRAAFTASDELILCEGPFDALTFWAAGYRNVTTCFGVQGFTDEHRVALQTHKTKRVLIAYDRDPAGDRAAETLALELAAMGIETYRILFPHGMDANEYACKVTPAPKSLGLVIRKALWLGKGQAPEFEPGALAPLGPAPEPAPPTAAATSAELPGQLLLFAAGQPTPAPTVEPAPSAPAALSASKEPPAPSTPDKASPLASPVPPAPVCAPT